VPGGTLDGFGGVREVLREIHPGATSHSRPILTEEPGSWLPHYGAVRSRFRVESRLVAEPTGTGGFTLREEPVAKPWWKDYDVAAGGGPATWGQYFDLRRWGFLAAWIGDRLVGCAAVVTDAPELFLLEGRRDLAMLWDLRVEAELRGTGIGRALLEDAARWARQRGARELRIETQDINVRACRFYERMGCWLERVTPRAYTEFPDEVQFLWHRWL